MEGAILNFDARRPLIAAVEALRRGRTLVCFFNFDRQAVPPLAGLNTQFHADVKEALFRVLKESQPTEGIDLCLYTRGGDINAVWPLVSLIREFDPDFEVLVPFRCHSAGTLAALGARRIVLGPISELSPIDPSTGNQFNPREPTDSKTPLAISVEDVRAYHDFVVEQLATPKETASETSAHLAPFLQKLATDVHPLALGNVHRVLQQIKQLAKNLLALHPIKGEDREAIITALTAGFYSHLHMINRQEAKQILGERVEFASPDLVIAMDRLLRGYEEAFNLRHAFFLSKFLEGKQEAVVRFAGGVAESRSWSYLFITNGTVRQFTKLPPNVQLQLPAGQPMPLVPGLPRETQVEIQAQGWIHNAEPLGVTK